MPHIIGFAGYSNSGKTTVIKELLGIFKHRGYKVAAIKHASHGYDIDTPEKDSWQHFQAGADQVVIAGPTSLTIHERLQKTPQLHDILHKIITVDYILVEGFKEETGYKVEIIRDGLENIPIVPSEYLLALVSDSKKDRGVPCFAFDEMESLADLLTRRFPVQKPEAI
jgi:molybdopterin-guanine dinucleotide biosynthesis protein B